MQEGYTVKLFDHGYVKFIESWGSDERIIEAARMSTDKGFLQWDAGTCPTCHGSGKFGRIKTIKQKESIRIWNSDGTYYYEPAPETQSVIEECLSCNGKGQIPGDMKLLAFLDKMRHSTPFEFAGAVIEVQAPIAVFREWHRHRTQSYAEMSARYTPLPDFNYVPTVERCMIVASANKQAMKVKGADELTHESVLEWLEKLAACYDTCEEVYQDGLKKGIPKELARMCVPVGRYTRMRAQAVLRNWLAFLTLRMDAAAQFEIRMYSQAVHQILCELFPRTMELFNVGRN